MAGRLIPSFLVKKFAVLLLMIVFLYFLAGAVFLHFFVQYVAVAKDTWTAEMLSETTVSFPQVNGRQLFARVVGHGGAGCVVIFPGRHGPSAVYEEAVVPPLVQRNLRVFLIAYPGQLGSGSASALDEIPALADVAVEQIARGCPSQKLVLVGRSLGSMVAAYAARRAHAAGLVLESTSPRLSTFLQTTLRSRWYLRPLLLLPIQRLLVKDYDLKSALGDTHAATVIFQGTNDEVTPIFDLSPEALPENVKVVSVEHATHSNAFSLVLSQYVETISDMLDHAPTP